MVETSILKFAPEDAIFVVEYGVMPNFSLWESFAQISSD